jgi:hypothetical protein
VPRTPTEPADTSETQHDITHDLAEPLTKVAAEMLAHMDGIEQFARRVDPKGLRTVLGPQRAKALDLRLRRFIDSWATAYGPDA